MSETTTPRPRERPAREVTPRVSIDREAAPRTEHDAGHVGIGANPGPAERAQPAREASIPEPVTRVRREHRQIGSFELPKHLKKPGWDYEYKTIRVQREPVDPSEIQDIRMGGWRPEKACDWPDLVEPGTAPDAPIERLGQRLYGRPMSLTLEAKEEDYQAAISQQRDRTNAAASGRSAIRGEGGLSGTRGVKTVEFEPTIEQGKW